MNVVLKDEKSEELKKKEKALKSFSLTRSLIRGRVLQVRVLWQHISVLAEWRMFCSNVHKMF